jgi:hypothetical protein
MESLAYKVTLTTMDCDNCGGVFALNEGFRAKRKRDGGSWRCPYCGHSWVYSEWDTDRLKRELAAERVRKDRALSDANEQRRRAAHAEAVARGHKAAKTRIKNRIKNGVCPCCTRTFQNLAAHMSSKHPDYLQASNEQVA